MLSPGPLPQPFSSQPKPSIWLLCGLLVGVLVDTCAASHFRGAHFWWRPLSEENVVELRVRVAWRQDYSERTGCNQSVIDRGLPIGPVDAGFIMCEPACGRVGDMDFYCTDFSDRDHWVSGVRTHVINTGRSVFEARWRGRSWLEEVLTDKNNVDWSFRTTFDLRPRPDNGAVNTSPRAAVGTLFRVQQGCQQTLVLPISDEDGDRVACRWAVGDLECGGICGGISGFTLHPNTCSFTIAGTNPARKYALAVQIEDFLWNNDTYGPLSSVPLQFIIHVFDPLQPYDGAGWNVSQTLTCDVRPHFVPPSPEAESCTTLEAGQETSRHLVARARDTSTAIREINTVSSVGMRKTVVSRYGDDKRDFHVTVTWTPQEADIGEHIFCFTAVDSTGLSSDQRCVFITVGESGLPVPTPQHIHYNTDTSILMVDYNTMITVSSGFHELEIYLAENETLVRRLDTSNPELVYTSNNTLHIVVELEADTEFYLLLDAGIVITGNQCGSVSEPVLDNDQLPFTTASFSTTSTNPQTSTTAKTTTTATRSTTATKFPSGTNIYTSTGRSVTQDSQPDIPTSDHTTGRDAGVHTTGTYTGVQTTGKYTGVQATGTYTGVQMTDTYTGFQTTGSQENGEGKDTEWTTDGPTPDARRSSSSGDDDDDYTWLIVVVVVVVVFFILLVIIAILVRRHMKKESDEYDREARQEQYLRSLEQQTKIVGYDGPYAPNFHDIEVKFR